ncbi:uncharacterized protein GIQ15_00942 [Arthroderma uncinatum]|uniref:uncharacterized protein n=1 Tax=Arthroderma uncinatum TaxID=74035 RepID=UPI00144A58EB|nr:uncharacterized protein GIQ15_00942 [Arthroderma uncinatum]KAF3491425.1 hypothetical protein GIQ15_00942 [Arthroderma uncinatum]
MASMLPAQRSTVQCLQRRFTSPASVNGLLRTSLSQSSSSRSQPLLTSSSRTIVTHINRPFSPPKSTRSQGSLQQQPAAPETTPALPLTNLPYFIRRTPSNQLPIYLVTKAGGTKQETRVRKTEGDLNALRADLVKYLGLEAKPSEVYINQINGHVTIKGWRKPEVMQFLLDRKF